METPVQSSGSPQFVSTPASTEPSLPGPGDPPTSPSRAAGPPVDLTPLGDSPSVGVSVDAATNTPPGKSESADSTPAPRSVNSAGDPPAVPLNPPQNLSPVVEGTPPPTPPSISEPAAAVPPCPPKNDVRPALEAVPELKPAAVPEEPALVPSAAPVCAQNVQLPPSKPNEKDAAAAADKPPARSTTSPPAPVPAMPVPAKRPVKLQQATPSSVSSVTPTPSTSTLQSNGTTPRSFCPDQQPLATDDVATSSSYGSVKTPGSAAAGSYLRSYQRRAVNHRRDSGGNTPSTAAEASPSPAYYHDRKSRSVSPTSQTDSYRSSTSSTLPPPSTVQGRRGRSPVPAGLSPDAPSAAEWARSPSPYYMRASPRHVTEYRHCVTLEDDVRLSQRERENTHRKLFGADVPDSPRTAAVASAAAAGGLTPKQARRCAEDTQATLFGPPDPHRKSSRPRPDTYKSLFGPPLAHAQRRSRSCFHDTSDLLHHDASAGGRSDEEFELVRGRYALRHQDTGAKLFGDGGLASPPAARPCRDHDIFLVRQSAPSTTSTTADGQPSVEPLPGP